MRRSLALISLFALLSTAALAGAQTVFAAEDEGPAWSILGPDTVEVSGEEGEDSATGYLTLLNSGDKPVQATVSFQASSAEGLTAKEVQTAPIQPREAQRVSVVFSGLDTLDDEAASGQLVVDDGKAASSKAVEVKPGLQPVTDWTAALIGASFAAALCLALYRALRVENLDALKQPVPAPKLSFESWGTSFTAVGAVLGTVLGAVTYPSFPEQIGKDALINLNLLFGGLIVLAPFVFLALRKSDGVAVGEEAGPVGTNLTMLLTCAVTLWAVLGEIGAITLLGWELIEGDLPHTALVVLALLVLLLACRYFLVGVKQLLNKEWNPPTPPSEGDEDEDEEVVVLVRPRSFDLRAIDSLQLKTTAFPMTTVASHPERREIEVAVPEPTAQPARRWSLL